jgi:hypothetical protein
MGVHQPASKLLRERIRGLRLFTNYNSRKAAS